MTIYYKVMKHKMSSSKADPMVYQIGWQDYDLLSHFFSLLYLLFLNEAIIEYTTTIFDRVFLTKATESSAQHDCL